MTRIWRAKYLAGDETRFTPREDFLHDAVATGWDWSKGPPPGHTWTLLRADTGEVLGVAGISKPRPDGGWQAWAQLSEIAAARDWARLLWLARQALGGMDRCDVHNITASARTANAAALRCLKRLGFEGYGKMFIGEGAGRVEFTLMLRGER